jgi:hypothetical protein
MTPTPPTDKPRLAKLDPSAPSRPSTAQDVRYTDAADPADGAVSRPAIGTRGLVDAVTLSRIPKFAVNPIEGRVIVGGQEVCYCLAEAVWVLGPRHVPGAREGHSLDVGEGLL